MLRYIFCCPSKSDLFETPQFYYQLNIVKVFRLQDEFNVVPPTKETNIDVDLRDRPDKHQGFQSMSNIISLVLCILNKSTRSRPISPGSG